MTRAYTVSAASVLVEKSSFNLVDKLNARTTCSFTVIEPAAEIGPGVEVTVTDDITDPVTTLFAGIVEIPEAYGDKDRYTALQCVDFSALLSKRLVFDAYVNTSAGDIVKDLITTVFAAEGITQGTIEDGPVLSSKVFNGKYGDVCMDQLAQITGFCWHVDYLKALHFYSRATNAAAFNLTDTSQNYSSLKVRRTRVDYRNQQYVRIQRDETDSIALEKPTPKPDGVSRSFLTRFPLAQQPRIFINSVEVAAANIGVQGLDTGKKWYFAYNSNVVTQDSGETVLTTTDVLEITYVGLYPAIIMANSPAGITERLGVEGGSGIHERITDQPDLTARQEGFDFAKGELDKYGLIPRIVTYTTYTGGLKAGQLQSIVNTLNGLNGDYLIESVTARDEDGITRYYIKALDGTALGGWETLFASMLAGSRRLIIRENEVLLLLVNTADEPMGWAEDATTGISVFACPVCSATLYPSTTLYPC